MSLHRGGGKFTAAHTTVIEAMAVVVDVTVKLEQVRKIRLAQITSVPSRKQRLKWREVPAGLEVVVRGKTAQQVVFFYIAASDRAFVQAVLGAIVLS